MIIHQFYDKGLAHASYAIIRTGKMVVIDPSRDPQPYYDFATLHEADIVGVIETHPDDGDVIELDDIKLKAINTPGHSPDSICILLQDEHGHDAAIFTGDTLFVGDVGRPDLREDVGNITAKKEELAKQMYHSTRDKLMHLPKNVVVYPAHGPGSLCGKNMSADLQSTIGRELRENYALQLMDELQFVKTLTADQPFVPKYFGHDVELNKNGAASFQNSVSLVDRSAFISDKNVLIIDTRPKVDFRNGHIKGSINLQNGEKFETWLGSIVGPNEKFYLIANTESELDVMIKKTAKIGYEGNIKAALLTPDNVNEQSADLDLSDFQSNPDNYTIVDVRNWGEVNDGTLFNDPVIIPLPELRERISEIPTDKPIVVHCAAGYRSAAASSIIAAQIKAVPVYDLGEAIIDIAKIKA